MSEAKTILLQEFKKNKSGRPRKYDSAEAFHKRSIEYLEATNEWSIQGWAVFLGFADDQSIYDYEKDSKFSYTIKTIRQIIISKLVENASSKDRNVAGDILHLKQFGFKDRVENTNFEKKEVQVSFEDRD